MVQDYKRFQHCNKIRVVAWLRKAGLVIEAGQSWRSEKRCGVLEYHEGEWQAAHWRRDNKEK